MTSNIFTSAIQSVVFFADAVQSVVFSAQIIQSVVSFALKSNSQSMSISKTHSINSFAISIQNLIISRTTSFASASVAFFDDSFLSSLMISKITSFYSFNLLQKNVRTDETVCWKWTFRDFRNSLKINNSEKLHYKEKIKQTQVIKNEKNYETFVKWKRQRTKRSIKSILFTVSAESE
jgi:hypothetical protein